MPTESMDEAGQATGRGFEDTLRGITEEEAAPPEQTAPEASVELFDDFEQARVMSSVRRSLFGRGRKLRIGRYVVERRLGAGGMGEVYLGRDEELQRKVAIKRVLTGPGYDAEIDGPLEHEQARLRREAQALARLSHPNVVQIYEFGEHEGLRFVAMEYIEGQDLASWLEQPRSWRAILDAFLAAGRGLAAAHAAGLVHRDFKPENVLVGASGEIRVADFGLARVRGRPIAASESSAGSLPEVEARLSVTGAVFGTVRYMSPEQLRASAEVDARSDQFSFCVALYEALWEQPPFAIDSVQARLAAFERGEASAPPRGLVPARLWRVIRRGLAREPEARWPDMESLLDGLEGIRRRRGLIAGAGIALALGLGWVALEPSAVPPPSCAERSALELAEAWSPELAAQLGARYEGVSWEQGGAIGEQVRADLDAWTDSWATVRTQVCSAREASARPEHELHAQELCLTRARRHAAALVELLTERESAADALARGLDAVSQLPAAEACVEDDALLRIDPPPAERAADIDALRKELERAHQLRLLGRYAESRTILEAIEAPASLLDYAPLRAELHTEQAKLELVAGALDEGVRLLLEAVDAAELGHHERLAADLWTELALRTILALDDPTRGAERLRRAQVAAVREGSPTPGSEARLGYAEAELLLMEGEAEAGEARLREVVEIASEHAPRDYPTYLSRLADLRAREDLDAGLALHREALAAAEARFGAAHPVSADFYYELGSALVHAGQEQEGRPLLERALDIWTRGEEQRGRKLAWTYQLLGEFALAEDDLERAAHHAQALGELRREILPEGHREHAATELLLAGIAGRGGERALALEHCKAALGIWSDVLGPDDPRIIDTRVEAAGHLIALGRPEEAAREFQLIVEHGDPFSVLAAYLGFAELELMRGRLEQAAEQLRALDQAIGSGQLPELGDYDDYTHALLWAIVELRGEGRASVRAGALAQIEPLYTPEQLDAWFDDLGLSARERQQLGL